MSNRASIRRIEKIETKRIKEGYTVLNLCGSEYRLRPLQGPTESLSRCYAAALGNCTGPMSKEHYISENILKQFDTLQTDAFPWLRAAAGPIAPKDAMAANCLCKYHNEFLSPLDSLAGKMFDNIVELMNPRSAELYLWGPSFARWILKVLVGIVAAKHVTIQGQRMATSEIPPEWIEILFGLREFPAGHGLYMTPVVGEKMTIGKRIQLSTLLLDGKLRGLRFGFGGVDFLLCMDDPARAFNQNHPAYPDILYRPRGMNVDQRANRMQIFWE